MRAVCNHPHISMRICPGLSQPDLAPAHLAAFQAVQADHLHHKCMHHEMHACMPGPCVLPHETSIC